MCALKRGHPSTEGARSSPVRNPSGSTAALQDQPDHHDVLGPFTPKALPSEAPANALVRIDLKAWHTHSRKALDVDLKALVIPRRWDDHVLSFLGAQLPQVAERIQYITDKVEPTLAGAPVLRFDIGDLSSGAVTILRRILDDAQFPFRIAAEELEVSEPDHDRVARILRDIRATDTASQEPPALTADDADDPNDAVAFASLDALYGAVGELRRHPGSRHAADHLADVCARCPISSPYGLEPVLWHDLVAEAGALAGDSQDLDEGVARRRVASLYDRLKAIVA